MSIEMNMSHAAADAATEILEGAHWAPPAAPLDMPEQVLERAARPARAGLFARLWLALSPRQRV